MPRKQLPDPETIDTHILAPEALQLASPSYMDSAYNSAIDDYLAAPGYVPELKSEDLLKNRLEVTPEPKRRPAPPKSRPAFVVKIWLMVNDPENQDQIHWSEDGESFKVPNRESFMKKVLPKYFKHLNFSSFVRQLNMYGWHKVQDLGHSGLANANDETWQFENPNFKRGREDLLDRIVRNKPGKADKDEEELDVNLVVKELNKIKSNQSLIADDLRRVKKDNLLLWQEVMLARDRYAKQNETLNTILRFIASVFQGGAGNREIGLDSSVMGALLEAVKKSGAQVGSSTAIVPAEKLSSRVQEPAPRTRLMLEGAPQINELGLDVLSDNIEPETNLTGMPHENGILQSLSLASNGDTPAGATPSDPKIDDFLLEQPIYHDNNALIKSPSPSGATIESLHNNIVKQDESINTLADLLSRYIPEYDEAAASTNPLPDDFNVDDFLANTKDSAPGTPNLASIEVLDSTPGLVKRPAEETDQQRETKHARVK